MPQPAQKNFQIAIPKRLFEQFFALFPGRGERSVFLRECIEMAVELGPSHKFSQLVRQLAEERYGTKDGEPTTKFWDGTPSGDQRPISSRRPTQSVLRPARRAEDE